MTPQHLPYKLGSSDANTGGEITQWGQWFNRYAKSYAPKVDGYYGNDEFNAVKVLQSKLGGVPVTGVFDLATAVKCHYVSGSPTLPPSPVADVWFYSAPGSGAPWNAGPSFEVGLAAERRGMKHQPIGFPIGGYLGLMGGDPGLSYNDVIAAERNEFVRLVQMNPGRIIGSGYSQSADGLKRAVAAEFGDGGRLAHRRGDLKKLILFGDPSRQQGPTKLGNNPPGWGIARYVAPQWVEDITYSITNNGDFYACTDDNIRPLFYEWFIKADTDLPFVIYTAQIIIPALLNLLPGGKLLGGLTNPAATGLLSLFTGMAIPMLGTLIQGIGASNEAPNPKLLELLSIQGVLTNLPALIKLLLALPGIQTHGEYHLGKPEFGGRSGIDVGIQLVNDFR